MQWFGVLALAFLLAGCTSAAPVLHYGGIQTYTESSGAPSSPTAILFDDQTSLDSYWSSIGAPNQIPHHYTFNGYSIAVFRWHQDRSHSQPGLFGWRTVEGEPHLVALMEEFKACPEDTPRDFLLTVSFDLPVPLARGMPLPVDTDTLRTFDVCGPDHS